MKRYLYFFAFVLITSFQARADAAGYSMHELLLETNLIAHVKITNNTRQNFNVKILAVLHHNKSGVKAGDYLQINNDFDIVCPSSFAIEYAEQKKEALAFLSFHKGAWYLNKGEIGFFKDNKITITFYKEGYFYNGTISEWKNDLADYFEHFRYNSEGKLRAKYAYKEQKRKEHSALVELQYYRLYWNLKQKIREKPQLERMNFDFEVEEEIEEPAEDMEIHIIVDSTAIHKDSVEVIMKDLLAYIADEYPSIMQADIQGNVYYSLLFEKDGTISEVKILRSFIPEIDIAIKSYYEIHNQWTPAILNNAPVRYRQSFPLKIRMN